MGSLGQAVWVILFSTEYARGGRRASVAARSFSALRSAQNAAARERARQLGLSDADVARRADLSERRYGHYVRGTREPDFSTLLRICDVLDVTPNPTVHDRWLSRLVAAGRRLEADDVKLATRQVEAILEHRNNAKTR